MWLRRRLWSWLVDDGTRIVGWDDIVLGTVHERRADGAWEVSTRVARQRLCGVGAKPSEALADLRRYIRHGPRLTARRGYADPHIRPLHKPGPPPSPRRRGA